MACTYSAATAVDQFLTGKQCLLDKTDGMHKISILKHHPHPMNIRN